MKSIFTYPNNSPEYIDPDYLGDANNGFYRRVSDLKDGDYLPWTGISPTASVDAIITGLGKYNNMTGLEETTGNNSFYKFHNAPVVEFTFREKAIVVATLQTERIGNDVALVAQCAFPHGQTDGTQIYGASFTTTEFNEVTNPMYIQVVNSTRFRISADAAGLIWAHSWLDNTIYNQLDWGDISFASRTRTIRRDIGATPGSLIKLNEQQNTLLWDTDYTQINLLFPLSGSGQEPVAPVFTGTLNNTVDNFYIERSNSSGFTYIPYTDAAKTTIATINEVLFTTVTKTYTTAGTKTFAFEAFADWGISGTTKTLLNDEVTGWARIYATVRDGSFTGQSSSPAAIPLNAPVYTYEFFWEPAIGSDYFTMYDQRSQTGGNFVQDFILADLGSGVDVDITIEFINPAWASHGWGQTRLPSTNDAGGQFRDDPDGVDYEIDTATLLLPGVEQFQYQDTNNVTQTGANFDSQWLPGNTSNTPLSVDESMPSGSTINLDTNGRLTGFNFPAEISELRGRFNNGDTRLLELGSAPNTYVPPVLTPAELADVWDTDDEWLSSAQDSRKVWPDVVTPNSAKIILNTPSISAASQNGIKFTRGAGFTKWRLEVDYPPMKADKFREFHAIAQAAQGQVIPFYFKLRSADNTNILWSDFGKAGTTTPVRLKESSEASDTTIFLEGFQSFEASAFETGEVFIDGDNENGQLHTVVNTVESNAYGEAKIRTAMPLRSAVAISSQIYKDPYWAVVTLSEDDFEYSVDTAGFYYMSVAFDLDKFANDGSESAQSIIERYSAPELEILQAALQVPGATVPLLGTSSTLGGSLFSFALLSYIEAMGGG